MRIGVVPGLYFKSYSRFTESRIPFEALALCGLVDSVPGAACVIVDFNIKGETVDVGTASARFPGLALDAGFYEGAAAELVASGADGYLFAISIHTNGNLFHSVRIAQALRRQQPDAVLAFAGLGPSSRHQDLLESYPHLDLVLRGEAEATAEEVIGIMVSLEESQGSLRDGVRSRLEGVPGLTFRAVEGEVVVNPERPLIEDLDTLPLPLLDLYGDVISRATQQTRDLRYLSVEEHIHLEAGRGCPFSCTFCSNRHLWRRRYRLKSPERLIEEIRICKERYGGQKFLLHQQLFTANRHRTAAFCEAMIDADLGVEWSCFTRTDCVNPELLELMSCSGCNTIMFGIESGSQRIQDLVRKKTKLDQVREQVRMVIAHGIKPQLSYIVGFPEETPDDLKATLDMYCDYKFAEGVESQIGLLVPVGGTDVLEENIDALDFDGVQTTTWYTRFFDEDSYDEMAALPRVYPQNHYVRTEAVSRDLLKFVKVFDIVASHLRQSCQYAILNGLTQLPFETYDSYQRWRSRGGPFEARHWDGQLRWDADISSIVIDFAQFMREEIAPREEAPSVLASLLRYELALAMVNARMRDRGWDEICAAAPASGDDNFIADPHVGAEVDTEVLVEDALIPLRSGDGAAAAAAMPRPARYLVRASGPSTIEIRSELADGAVASDTHEVFRQVEF